MPEIAHNHQFTAMNGGFACELPNCTVFVTRAQINANIEMHTPGTGSAVSFNLADVLNRVSRKAGHS